MTKIDEILEHLVASNWWTILKTVTIKSRILGLNIHISEWRQVRILKEYSRIGEKTEMEGKINKFYLIKYKNLLHRKKY